MKYKICSKCKTEKHESEFGKRYDRPIGLRSTCKQCDREKREQNKEHLQKLHSDYYQNNKEKINEKNIKWAKNNPEKVKIIRKKHIEVNKEKILEKEKVLRKIRRQKETPEQREKRLKTSRDYYYKNKEKLRANYKEYKKNRKNNDNKFNMSLNISKLFRTCLKKQSIKKCSRFFSYTGISMNEYINHFSKFELWNEYRKGGVHIDHIIPSSAYDYNNLDDIKKCWQPENLRLIPSKENIIKKDTIDFKLIEIYNIKHLLPERYNNAEI
jgi:hypothetical protein